MATQDQHFLQGKKIAVAGAGIAGLEFTIALNKQWTLSHSKPEIAVYDRDRKQLGQRRQGYSLSLNGMDADGGLIALRDLGLLDEILKHSLTGPNSARSFRMWDGEWNELLRVKAKPYGGLPTAGIRIARKELRNILIEAAESVSTIAWETSCTSAERLSNGRVRVHLDGPDGSRTEECDLLIAADGAHSKIREALRPDDTLDYQGVVQIGGVAKFHDGEIPKPIDESWGMSVSGQGVSCFMSPVDETSAVWALSCEEAQPRTKIEIGQSQALVEEAKRIGSMFKGPFPAMVAATDPETAFVIPARDKKPFAHDQSLKGIIFTGDSNHAVSPFAGNGANLALKDGWDLARELAEGDSMEAAVSAYDALAVPRATKTLGTSHQRMAVAHSTGVRFYFFRVAFSIGGLLLWLLGI